MKLIEFGNKIWQVLAVCDENEDCQVLDYIINNRGNTKLWKQMFSKLRLVIPENGPQLGHNSKVSEHYCDGISAFKKNPSRGPKPRIYFFRDGNRLICTEAFNKRGEDINPFINRALDIQQRYHADKRHGDIEIDIYESPEE